MSEHIKRLTPDVTLKKTILASIMSHGFWERWVTHGVDQEYVLQNRSKMSTLEGWISVLEAKAIEHFEAAKRFVYNGDFVQAELGYRTAGIYYDLIHWVFPVPEGDKVIWYLKCLDMVKSADNFSSDLISYHELTIDGKVHVGRVRVPYDAVSGVVIICAPIDSAKEEMFTYEMDFAREGFAVVSFDGTGQGETLILHGHKASPVTWYKFTKELVLFTNSLFPHLPIHTFGTSSGGSWAIQTSRHPLVHKVVAVSPAPKAIIDEGLPDYFQERLRNILEDFYKGSLPSVDYVSDIKDIIVFHGAKDLLLDGDEVLDFFNHMSQEKRYVLYEDEGHCCNFKLPEIRHRSSNWFKGVSIDEV